mmetsp:Transcript_34545/g.83571  ORF Transcript_34545/g.83571 Transcript_34545/m.83571 type:complete len:253 (+) Transcript_34545:175-933(+)
MLLVLQPTDNDRSLCVNRRNVIYPETETHQNIEALLFLAFVELLDIFYRKPFNDEFVIRVDAHVCCDSHGLESNVLRAHISVHKSAGSSHCVWPSRPNPNHAVMGLNNISVSGEGQRDILIYHYEEGAQMAKIFVRAPSFRHLDACTHQLSGSLLQPRFEPLYQGQAVCSRTGKACNDAPAVEYPDLLRVGLETHVSKRNLSIPDHVHFAVFPNRKYRCRAPFAVPVDRAVVGSSPEAFADSGSRLASHTRK